MKFPSYMSSAVFVLACVCLTSCERSKAESPTRDSNFVTSNDGVSIHYKATGDGPISLVFVHGWCCDLTYWSKQTDHFKSGHRVVAVDLAGHGESGSNREKWTMSGFGEDVSSVIAHLGLRRVVLVGHSMGGPVILEAYKRIPEKTIGLVIVDQFRDLNQPARTPAEVDEFLKPFDDDFVGMMKTAVREMLFTSSSDPSMVDKIVDDMSAASPEIALPAMRDLRLWDVKKALQSIQAPMWAINSDYYQNDVESLENHGLRVVLMSGVGHFVMMEDPDTFNRLLGKAIAEFEKAGTS